MSTERGPLPELQLRGVPAGLIVRLHRGRIQPGKEEEATRWMQMLNDRYDETLATLDRERMAVELVFRSAEPDGQFLTWITVSGEGESVETSTHQLDIDHLAYDELVRERGWMIGEPQLVLLPAPVRSAVLEWSGVGGGRVSASM